VLQRGVRNIDIHFPKEGGPNGPDTAECHKKAFPTSFYFLSFLLLNVVLVYKRRRYERREMFVRVRKFCGVRKITVKSSGSGEAPVHSS
jgi:hypothetical protein